MALALNFHMVRYQLADVPRTIPDLGPRQTPPLAAQADYFEFHGVRWYWTYCTAIQYAAAIA
jgi:hypothetical protein